MGCEYAPENPIWLPNGCGPKAGASLWAKLLSKVVPELAFHADCDCHDNAYKFGSLLRELEERDMRLAVDREFLKGMLAHADSRKGIKRQLLRGAAYVYYRNVRWFGEKQFTRYADRESWRKGAHALGYADETIADLIGE